MQKEIAERDRSFDALKYLALIYILIIHFIYFFCEGLLLYRDAYPYSLLFKGFSAKAGAAMFAVIAGYFSFAAGKRKNIVQYTYRKYIFYVICCLVANIIYVCFDRPFQYTDISLVIQKSFLLKDSIYYYLWFVEPFFLGNLLNFVLGKLNVPIYGILAVVAVLFYAEKYKYICVTVLGAVLYWLLDQKLTIFRKWYAQILLFVGVFFLIKQTDERYVFFMEGLCAFLLCLMVKNNERIQKILNNRFTSYFGRKTMAAIIVHYGLLHLFQNSGIRFRLILPLWLLTVHLAAIPVDYAIQFLYKALKNAADRLYDMIESKVISGKE